MCGIVGYVGNQNVEPILINGLKNLEYRGYDSAGIAVLEKNNLLCLKNKGRVRELENLVSQKIINSNIGIAHTRWATHGKPSTENSHPHLDNKNIIAVVHNGIIENYNEIKQFLIKEGYNFKSQTDTEVIPNLIEFFYKNEEDSEKGFLNAINKACNKFVGSYAICIVTKDITDKIFVARRSSPLVIGIGKDENYISSDIPAILSKTKDFYFLEDNEYAVISKSEIDIFNNKLEKINKEVKNITWEADSNEKGAFEDYMLKEIFEQPKTVKDTIGYRLPLNQNVILDELNLSKEYLESVNKIYIVACGTAMHAGVVGKELIEQLVGIPVEVEVASEFRYKNPIVDKQTLSIFISQSGETADTIAALKLAKEKGARTISISNVMGSSITREADYTIYTSAGPEIAVASTKAYTAQIALLSILAIHFAEILDKNVAEELKQSIRDIPKGIEDVLKNMNDYKELAKEFKDVRDVFFIGRGLDYATSRESSLKLKEITYIHSESYQAGELKHGPIALIEEETPVICTITDEKLLEKTVSNVQEVISRGAKSILITSENIEKGNYYKVLNIPKTNRLLSPIIAIVPMQLLSYFVAKEKGLDVDKPRNLAKSVTVE